MGVTALSKGVASFKVLNEMKRQSVVDAHGFMIPLSDLKKIQEKFSENNGNGLIESPHLENTEEPAPEERRRSGSPRKSKREKSPTKPQKQKWEFRDEARKAKVALNRQQTEVPIITLRPREMLTAGARGRGGGRGLGRGGRHHSRAPPRCPHPVQVQVAQ